MNRDRFEELNELDPQERASLERMLGEFSESAAKEAEKPELFWASMRTRVAAEIRKPQSHRGLGWAATLAAVSAMVVFVAVPSHTPQHRTPVTNAATSSKPLANDDEALLRSVAEATDSEVPDALAPATVLTSEMDRGLTGGNEKGIGRNNQ